MTKIFVPLRRILCRTQKSHRTRRHDLRTAQRLAPAPAHRRQAARHHLCFRRDVGSGGESPHADIEKPMLDLLDRVGEPILSGARNNLEGRSYH